MREIKVEPTPVDTDDYPEVEIKVDDVVVKARRPKEAVMVRAAGIFGDKYASNSLLARVAFEFLESCVDADSWVYLLGRLNDRDDAFDTEHLGLLFEAMFEEFSAQTGDDDETPAPNRQARRAKASARR